MEQVTVPTPPSDSAGRVSNDQREVRHAPGNHRAGPDKGITPDGDATHDGGIGAHRTAPLQPGGLVQRVPVDLGARVDDVRQDTRRSEKHIIVNHHTRIDRDIVLNLDVVADRRPTIDVHVLSYDAVCADPCALHDVREMPDLCANPDLSAVVDVGGFVDEIRQAGLTLRDGRAYSACPAQQ